MGFWTEKKQNNVTTTEYAPYGQSSPSKYTPEKHNGPLTEYEKKDLKYKKAIRVLRFLTRLITMTLSGFMIGTMSWSLAKYFTTRTRTFENTRVWNNKTVLWPSFLILAVSIVTLILNVLTLLAYACGVGAANKTSSATGVIGYIMLGTEIIVWAVTSGLYKMADNGNDLWGYSCGPVSAKIEGQVKSFVNFGRLCTAQTGTWYGSIAQAAMYTLMFVTSLLMVIRASGKKKIAASRDNEGRYAESGQF